MTEFSLMTIAALAVAPHLLKIDDASPTLAISIWFSALLARMIVVVLALAWLVLFIPSTEIFTIATHWCLHTAVPSMAEPLGVNGHALGDAATLAPLLVVIASLASLGYGMVRAAIAVRSFVRRTRIGTGPQQSIAIREPGVLLAVSGIARPRVLISDGAIRQLDTEELAAGLDHENGHIKHHHQRLLVTAELFRALARFLPGTNSAMRELVFHTERDADQWALRRNHDPSVLASAICKAALSPAAVSPALGGGQTARRVRALLSGEPVRSSGRVATRAFAIGLAIVVFTSMASVPTLVVAAAEGGNRPVKPFVC